MRARLQSVASLSARTRSRYRLGTAFFCVGRLCLRRVGSGLVSASAIPLNTTGLRFGNSAIRRRSPPMAFTAFRNVDSNRSLRFSSREIPSCRIPSAFATRTWVIFLARRSSLSVISSAMSTAARFSIFLRRWESRPFILSCRDLMISSCFQLSTAPSTCDTSRQPWRSTDDRKSSHCRLICPHSIEESPVS